MTAERKNEEIEIQKIETMKKREERNEEREIKKTDN
jgi:hypothetical protein